jgi:chromosome segregation ATPase
MPTQEERLATIERKLASLELELLYERRKAEESTPSESASNLKDVNYHLTMLLAIASGQERDIKTMKGDLGEIKDSLASLDQRFTSLEQHFRGVEGKQANLEQRFMVLEQRFTDVEGKLEQVVQLLTNRQRADD